MRFALALCGTIMLGCLPAQASTHADLAGEFRGDRYAGNPTLSVEARGHRAARQAAHRWRAAPKSRRHARREDGRPAAAPAPAIARLIEAAKATVEAPANILRAYFLAHRANATTAYLPAILRAKLSEIQQACRGFEVISTGCWRGGHPWHVAGTRRESLHCMNLAADFQVASYPCAYAHLAGWRGGLSGDPGVVDHVHISVGGREGRFCHHGRYERGCMFAQRRPAPTRVVGQGRRWARHFRHRVS